MNALQHVARPPRAWASPVRRAIVRAGRRVWEALEAHGRARSRHELLELADRWERYQPELAKELRHAAWQDTTT